MATFEKNYYILKFCETFTYPMYRRKQMTLPWWFRLLSEETLHKRTNNNKKNYILVTLYNETMKHGADYVYLSDSLVNWPYDYMNIQGMTELGTRLHHLTYGLVTWLFDMDTKYIIDMWTTFVREPPSPTHPGEGSDSSPYIIPGPTFWTLALNHAHMTFI